MGFGFGGGECDNVAMRRYRVRFTAAMAAYVVVIVIAVPSIRYVDSVWLKALLALLPMAPIGFAVRELVLVTRAMDELQRRIQFEAVAVASLLTCFLTLAWGLLEKAGLPALPAVMVTPIFCGIYGMTVLFVAHRYR